MREHDCIDFNSCSTFSDFKEFVDKYLKIKDHKSKNLDIARALANMQKKITRIDMDNDSLEFQKKYRKFKIEVQSFVRYRP